MSDGIDKAMSDTRKEIERARAKFREPTNLLLAWLEEIAETIRELQWDKTAKSEEFLTESLHAAAMNYRLREDVDPDPDDEAMVLMDALGLFAEAKQDHGDKEILAAATLLRERAAAIEAKYAAKVKVLR